MLFVNVLYHNLDGFSFQLFLMVLVLSIGLKSFSVSFRPEMRH